MVCPRCGYDNPLGRIFCMGCGEKLDLSRVKSSAQIDREEAEGKPTTAPLKLRLRKTEFKLYPLIKRICRIAVLLLFLIFGFLIWRQPSFKEIPITPEAKESAEETINRLKDAMKSKAKEMADLTEKEVASYIFGKLSYKPAESFLHCALSKILVEFNQGDQVSVVLFWTLNLKTHKHDFIIKYTGNVKVAGNELVFEPHAASLGKCPIPKFLFGWLSHKLGSLGNKFHEEFLAVVKQGWIKVEPGKVTVGPSPV